jgi:predicted sulfurtransferase
MSVNKLDVLNIAGYKFEPLSDIDSLVQEFQLVCDNLDLKGSVYLSPNGINFSLAGSEEAIQKYLYFMEQDERFLNIPLKKTYSETQPFRRMKVRPKKEIISLGREDINPRELTGDYVTPKELYAMYENNEDVIVLDTRNEYETRVGLFENAVDLQLDTFRDFPNAIEQLPEEYKDKQIVMYCTGGIRCEKASAVMLKAGFSDVKQLEGGVLDYFKETGGKYWNGDCFVFDERVALDTDLNETEYIYCYICREPLSAGEKASPDFKINEYCPYCIKK